MKPKILYHGGDRKIKNLIPREPENFDLPENTLKAIFATPDKNYAISMGLTNTKYTSSFKGNTKINFVRGQPKNKYVYLHYLNPKTFVENRPGEYISKVAVKPYKIEKFRVDELQNLWRKSSKKELKEFLKDRQKWRKEHKDY